jgi:hypothetical protein
MERRFGRPFKVLRLPPRSFSPLAAADRRVPTSERQLGTATWFALDDHLDGGSALTQFLRPAIVRMRRDEAT